MNASLLGQYIHALTNDMIRKFQLEPLISLIGRLFLFTDRSLVLLHSEEGVEDGSSGGSHGKAGSTTVAVVVSVGMVIVHVAPLEVASILLLATGVLELPGNVGSGTQLELLNTSGGALHLSDLGATFGVAGVINIDLEVSSGGGRVSADGDASGRDSVDKGVGVEGLGLSGSKGTLAEGEAGHGTADSGVCVGEDLSASVGDTPGETGVVDGGSVLVLSESEVEDGAVRVVSAGGHDLPSETVVDLSISTAGVPPAAGHLENTLGNATGGESDIFLWHSVGEVGDLLAMDVLLLKSLLLGSISGLVSNSNCGEDSGNESFHSEFCLEL